MNIGIPKEQRPFEFRVGMTPIGVQMLKNAGHTCYVEHDAGLGAGFSDKDYQEGGAKIVYSAHEVFGRADLLLKVARPMYEEIDWLQPGATMVGLLHLGSSRQDKIELLSQKQVSAIALEQIQLDDGSVPVRKPLSVIGGRLAAQISARLLQNNAGGKGILLGGVAGVPPAEVVVIGAGLVGAEAVHAFVGMGAHVTVLDINTEALQRIYDQYSCVVTMISYERYIERVCGYADVVVVAILTPHERPPIVINREVVRSMKPRSIIMDVSIDEGGAVETSRPTTHEHPTFTEEGVIHYCVPNIPSVVARTSTYAYLNAAFPFILELANKGTRKAVNDNPAIDRGTAIFEGKVRALPQLVTKG